MIFRRRKDFANIAFLKKQYFVKTADSAIIHVLASGGGYASAGRLQVRK
jgi:hypothetical protein